MEGLPSTTRTLLRGLLRRRPGLRGRTVPRIARRASGVEATSAWLRRYRALTEGPRGPTLPLLAPQMMAGPLHAQVLSDPAIPVGLLGLVHVAQTVTQHRDLPGRAPLDVEVWLEGHRPARQGAELDLHTEVRHAGDLAWDGVTTVLARGPWKDPRASGAPDEDDPIDARGAERWTIPENIGRRWRAVSGDPNPIHLHRLLARPFGFRGAIAHGTWLLARVAARLGEADGAARLECRFRRPVFLPGEVSFCTAPIDDGTRFTLRSPTSGKRHLEGRLIHLG